MASTSPLALPHILSPDDLDALSELSLVLAKVRAGLQSTQVLSAQVLSTQVPVPPEPTAPSEQLSFKDVPGATDKLKHKLQRARATVCALPDMQRTIGEQAREMEELEGRIGMQRALLERLRDGGVSFSKDTSAVDKMEI